MRKHVVVFVDVERPQPADRRDAIERVEEEPLMTLRFGTEYARRLRRAKGACANIWHLDELCLMINGERRWVAEMPVCGVTSLFNACRRMTRTT
jgi:hypothetical protein